MQKNIDLYEIETSVLLAMLAIHRSIYHSISEFDPNARALDFSLIDIESLHTLNYRVTH